MSQSADSRLPPAVEILDIDDTNLAQAGIEVIDMDLAQLQSTPLQARRVVVRLDGCVVVFYATNLRMRTRTRPSLQQSLLSVVTFGPQTSGSVDGLSIRPDRLLVVAPETSVGFVADPGYQSITFLVSPQELQRHLQIRHRQDDFAVPQGLEARHVGAAMAGQLFAFGKRLVELASQQPELFNECAETRAAAQRELLETLLETLDSCAEVEPERGERLRQTQSEMVRSVEQYALAHVDEPLYVTDLCKMIGTSERSLEYAFKAVMNLTPKAYLARLRLHRVRTALLQAQPGSTTVAIEALNWGFWHFGEFSRAYKNCFGELPSQTLRHKPWVAAKP
ncbi:helix-turn-helix domain-containing protein [Pseudomonas sp. N040]|uniref:helix-turn-helix domain-containing protein n=1 Tax=Pseudomonas sp. N040 TaxID=2785325 RepID=UPI0018A266C4|nr:helix-turn-helix domain-containing protein [Pseudomonas sp. N040]MBF7731270.1 helix-turn-helix domain-containing protein [Pseudomonas sp. N040]MBW7014913.1 helix-turn-helix domain-containing protein [Pseudomonas sp. N040]